MIQNGKRPGPAAGTRIAIVTPWFGPDLRGGAEQQSRQLAHHLAERGHTVDVLTTCCRSFTDDWGSNALRPGAERDGALTIRRFRTDKRDRRAFERVNSILLGLEPSSLQRSVSPVGDDDAETFCRNGINSEALCAYLASDGATYDHIVFLPYMFGTTLFGLPLVADRAYLQPCLHDEAYAYLERVAATIHAAKGLLFNSDGELEVAISLYGPGIAAKSFVVGEGIDEFPPGDVPQRVGDFAPASERYVLYIGRQDPAKNVSTLVAAFKGFRRSAPASRLKLVFAGERHVSYADSAGGIVDLGPVSESAKATLLEHCRALVQPSFKESFSRVIYEAWAFGRPVAVHADCPPTASVVARCGGGYAADTTVAWENVLRRIETDPDDVLDAIGARGRAFARHTTPWPFVIDRYERAFAALAAATPGSAARWDAMPDLPLVSALADAKTNLLYAGPVTSIDHLDALLVVFLHFLTMEREGRLAIAATAGSDARVFEELIAEVRRLDLADRLLATFEPATPQLQALYLGADVFISLARNEDNAREVRDAMWFDVPVLALDTAAVRAVASDSAILIRDTSDLLAIAALAELLAKDQRLRHAVIAAQRVVRSANEAQLEPRVDAAMQRAVVEEGSQPHHV